VEIKIMAARKKIPVSAASENFDSLKEIIGIILPSAEIRKNTYGQIIINSNLKVSDEDGKTLLPYLPFQD
jgi:hypothetical protein